LNSIEKALAGHPRGLRVLARTPSGVSGKPGLHGSSRLIWLCLEMTREFTGEDLQVTWEDYMAGRGEQSTAAAPAGDTASEPLPQDLESARAALAAEKDPVRKFVLARHCRELRGDADMFPKPTRS
jgi:hypothetical protein